MSTRIEKVDYIEITTDNRIMRMSEEEAKGICEELKKYFDAKNSQPIKSGEAAVTRLP